MIFILHGEPREEGMDSGDHAAAAARGQISVVASERESVGSAKGAACCR